MSERPTGIETVDVHHRVQMSLVGLVEQALHQGGDGAVAGEALGRLADFTQAHFQTEEQVMRRHGYPQVEAHAEAHRRLLEEVRGVQQAHARGAEGAGAAGSLRRWLLDHVRGMDQAFGEWCTARGIAEP
jgi:hemerythrin-like metal-binding protein